MEETLPLPKTFKVNGYSYELICRSNVAALYAGKNKTGGLCYEVHKVRVLEERIGKFKQSDGSYREVVFPKKEALACNEEFGKFAWSFCKLDNAMARYRQITMAESNGY